MAAHPDAVVRGVCSPDGSSPPSLPDLAGGGGGEAGSGAGWIAAGRGVCSPSDGSPPSLPDLARGGRGRPVASGAGWTAAGRVRAATCSGGL